MASLRFSRFPATRGRPGSGPLHLPAGLRSCHRGSDAVIRPLDPAKQGRRENRVAPQSTPGTGAPAWSRPGFLCWWHLDGVRPRSPRPLLKPQTIAMSLSSRRRPQSPVAPGLSLVTVPEPSRPGPCPLLPSPGSLCAFCPPRRAPSPLLWAPGRLLIFDARCGPSVSLSCNCPVKAVPCTGGSAGRAFGRWRWSHGAGALVNGISALVGVPRELPSCPCSRPHGDTTRR